MKDLRIGPDITLPTDAITQTFGVLAVRGAGKSNLLAVMAEEMFEHELPFVIIDPVGSSWGLRSRLEIPIFGGRHGDLPLERGAGDLLADLIVEKRLTAVLDVSEFSEGDKIRFLLDFARRLYRKNTQPLHLFLEEADDYCPQRPMREQAQLLRAWEDIVRRGRARGLGITMVTQRSAALNKNVLTQIETLFVLRTTSPQDRAAIEAWVKHQGGSTDMLATLPKLAAGEAWVWSPSWLQKFERVHIRRRHSWDSGSTPGLLKGAPGATLKDLDLGELSASMAATVERAKQHDPKELRRRIAELERRLADKPKPVPGYRVGRQDLVAIGSIVDQLEKFVRDLQTTADALRAVRDRFIVAAGDGDDFTPSEGMKPTPAPRRGRPVTAHRPLPPPPSNGALPRGETLILKAIAQYPQGAAREQLAVLTGYKQTSRNTYIQRLSQRGYVDVESDRTLVKATAAGVAALGDDFEPLPTGTKLREYWLGRLPEGERVVLEAIIPHWPHAVERTKLDVPYKQSSRNTYLQRLSARRLVECRAGRVTASDSLFDIY
jgi:hypothetical protein